MFILSITGVNEWGEAQSFGTYNSAMPIVLTTQHGRYLCGTSVIVRLLLT